MKTISGIHALGIVLAAMPVLSHASANDEKAVAALDTEYQAAVLKKDVAAMDRLLPANFVLVTGKGKAFSKADLLKSARDKSETYEHQEDTQQQQRSVLPGVRRCLTLGVPHQL